MVFSKKVTEKYKGKLIIIGNNYLCIMAKICLTVRLTNQTETKVDHNDPVILYGKVIDQWIKGTPGITG